MIRTAHGESLLSHAAWITLRHISAFQRRSETDRTDLFHRRQWGVIRQAALAANARLDDFLYRCVVITPEKLDIGLRHTEVGGTRLFEVSPSFPGAPDNWLEVFDTCRDVPNRYDISTQDGILQVLMTPEVKTVLAKSSGSTGGGSPGAGPKRLSPIRLLRWAKTPPTLSIPISSSANASGSGWSLTDSSH